VFRIPFPMFLGLYDPDQEPCLNYLHGSGSGSGSGSFDQQAKKIKINQDFNCFVTSQWHVTVSLKTDVNNKQKKNLTATAKNSRFRTGSGFVVQLSDPKIRIRIKMSRIRNTAWKARFGINHSGFRTLIADSGADPYNTKKFNKMTRKLKKPTASFFCGRWDILLFRHSVSSKSCLWNKD